MNLLYCTWFLLVGAVGQADQASDSTGSAPRRAAIPADAVHAAHMDIQSIEQPVDRFFHRYVFCPKPEDVGATVLAMNFAMNHARTLQRPYLIGISFNGGDTEQSNENGAVAYERLDSDAVLMRIDMRLFAPQVTQLFAVHAAWEKLAVDEPYFLIDTDVELSVTVPHEPYTASDGQTYRFKKRKIPVRAMGQHTGANGFALQQATGSAVPIVRADWFLAKLSHAINGGLYYDFRGITADAPEGDDRTAFDRFLDRYGVDLKEVERLLADQKYGMVKSRVTGRMRAVLLVRGVGSRLTENDGAVAITLDPSEEDFRDSTFNPFINPVDHRDSAREVIAQRSDGLLDFALFDASGVLQREAPANVVTDHTIPEGHPARLTPMISCIRCHSRNDEEGWRSLPFDGSLQQFARLTGIRYLGRVARVAEPTQVAEGVEVADIDPGFADRADGLIVGQFDKFVARARMDLSSAVIGLNPRLPLTQGFEQIGTIYNNYRYGMIDAQRALLECGIEVSRLEEAVDLLSGYLLESGQALGVTALEDVRAMRLLIGRRIAPEEWEQIYANVAARVYQARTRAQERQQDDG